MIQRMIRQRRRFAVLAVLAILSGLMMNTPMPWAAAVLTLICFFSALGAAIIAWPRRRFLVTNIAVFFLIAALVSRIFEPAMLVPLLGLFSIIAALIPARHGWADGVRWAGTARARARQRVDLPPKAVWFRLLPQPGRRHWDPEVSAIRPSSDPEVMFLEYDSNSRPRRTPIRVFDVEEGHRFRIRDLSLPDVEDGGPVKVTEYRVVVGDKGTELHMDQAIWRPGLWSAAHDWMDDTLGDRADHICATLEGRLDYSFTGCEWIEAWQEQ